MNPTLCTIEPQALTISMQEALRYLGIRSSDPPLDLLQTVQEELLYVQTALHCSAVWERFPLNLTGSRCTFGGIAVESKALANNLRGCTEVFLFAATIGIDVDRLLARNARLSPSKGVIDDALASAAIEAWCDHLNAQLETLAAGEGRFLRPRFSPGYGDFPLSVQPQLLDVLLTAKRIGLTLTDSLLMIPTKSVTALIGICDTPVSCQHGCETCIRQEHCPYRA
jgi:hypothetical protein